jgi:hypothetical protein
MKYFYYCGQLKTIYVRLKVPKTMTMKSTIFWDVAACSLIAIHRCFRGTCCLHLQSKKYAKLPLWCCLLSLIFHPEDGPACSSETSVNFYQAPQHDSQKIVLFRHTILQMHLQVMYSEIFSVAVHLFYYEKYVNNYFRRWCNTAIKSLSVKIHELKSTSYSWYNHREITTDIPHYNPHNCMKIIIRFK